MSLIPSNQQFPQLQLVDTLTQSQEENNPNTISTLSQLEDIFKKEKVDLRQRQIELNQINAQQHHKIDCEGIEILFPYSPYAIQEDYMKSVVQALQNKQNALMQSPTGTGKTLSLLCGTLGWLRAQRIKNLEDPSRGFNRILFCSRTHSQLKQVVRELKKTAYKPKVCILASREQYCLKREFSHLKDLELNGACKNSIKEKSCQYYNYSGKKQRNNILDDVLDIEDLQELGKSCKFCPYYYSNDFKDEADIVVLPYSFLLSQNRFSDDFRVILKDSIIIFDEAHNIQQEAEDGTSYQVNQKMLNESIKELNYLSRNLAPQMNTTRSNIQTAVQLVNAFKTLIGNLEKNSKVEKLKDGKFGRVSEVSELFESIQEINHHIIIYDQNPSQNSQNQMTQQQQQDRYERSQLKTTQQHRNYWKSRSLLRRSSNNNSSLVPSADKQKQYSIHNYFMSKQIARSNSQKASQDFEEIVPNLQNMELDSFQSQETTGSSKLSSMEKIIQISKILSTIIGDMQTMSCQNIDFFGGFIVGICNMYLKDKQQKEEQLQENLTDLYKFFFQKNEQEQSKIDVWCLDPSLAFKNIFLKQPHSLILSSGTLDPLSAWELELQLEFKVQCATSHIIDVPNNVFGGKVLKGPSGQSLNFSFQNRQNGQDTFNDLGQFLVNISQIVPNGILVFFSSGSLLKLAQDSWIQSGILNLIEKEMFTEPSNNIELKKIMNSYIQAAQNDDKGAILFCVCRGKISEGIDFTDKLARCVILVGVPYMPSNDTWVNTKQEYLNIQCQRRRLKNQKGLNGKDWFLLNASRTMNQAIGRVIRHKDDYGTVFLCDNRFSQSGISSWIKPAIQINSSYESLIQGLENFFKKKKVMEESKRIKKLEQEKQIVSPQSIEKNKLLDNDVKKIVSPIESSDGPLSGKNRNNLFHEKEKRKADVMLNQQQKQMKSWKGSNLD